MKTKTIFIAGHKGMVGSAINRQLSHPVKNSESSFILTCSKQDLDLTRQDQVETFFRDNQIDEVYICAAKVGGIHANNTYPAEFIYTNLMIANNIIQASHSQNVPKLLFLGSSCIYPKITAQPIPEEALLTGPLEPTNEAYAIAKIAGIKLCENYNRQYGRDYRCVMPTNLYGPGDSYHPENSHVIPALMQRIHHAKVNKAPRVVIWGTGNAKREFMHVDDLARGCIHVMNMKQEEWHKITRTGIYHLNIGTGLDCSIKSLAQMLCKVIGYKGELIFDTSKPDGTPRKLLDVSRVHTLGWKASINLEQGLLMTYQHYQTTVENSI